MPQARTAASNTWITAMPDPDNTPQRPEETPPNNPPLTPPPAQPPPPRRGRFAQDPPLDTSATDTYFEKLLKYIPGDIVAAFVALDGILKQGGNDPMWLSWAVFGALLVLTPFYICYVKTTPPGIVATKTFHWVASTVAFAVWVFALGGPFAVTFDWYRPVLGSVLLIITTLALPVFESIFYKSPPSSDGTI